MLITDLRIYRCEIDPLHEILLYSFLPHKKNDIHQIDSRMIRKRIVGKPRKNHPVNDSGKSDNWF